MDIGAFGIDPASKFATEKCKAPSGSTRWLGLLYLRIRYREWAAIRSGSAGLDFQKGSLRFRFLVVFSYRARLPTRALNSPPSRFLLTANKRHMQRSKRPRGRRATERG